MAVGFAEDHAPISGSRAERYQVVLHVEPETLRADGEPGMSELEDGTRFSAENSRRLACDASVVEVVKGAQGGVLGVGRRRRTYRLFSDAAGQVVFFDPRGSPIGVSAPPQSLGDDPLAALTARNRSRGVAPDWRTELPAAKRDADVSIQVVMAALEALDATEADHRSLATG